MFGSLIKLVAKYTAIAVISLFIGLYARVQYTVLDRTGSFVSVPTFQNVYLHQFLYAINDPTLDLSKFPKIKDPMAAMWWVNTWVMANIGQEDDEVVYGKSEYWAKASEILKNGRDDCDGHTILKYQLLKHMGFSPEDLNMVLVRVKGAPYWESGHAILRARVNGVWYLLDNLEWSVLQEPNPNYITEYYINEKGIKPYRVYGG